MVGINEKTSYNDLRTKLLQYERSNQTWFAENILVFRPQEQVQVPKNIKGRSQWRLTG